MVGFQYVEVPEGAIERAIKNKGITPGQFQPRMFKRSRVVPLDPMSQSFHEGIGHEVYRNPTGGIRCYLFMVFPGKRVQIEGSEIPEEPSDLRVGVAELLTDHGS